MVIIFKDTALQAAKQWVKATCILSINYFTLLTYTYI